MNTALPQILHRASAGFESARRLDGLAAGHPKARLHGHGFVAQVACALPPDWAPFPGGELQHLQQELQALTARLDHRLLNDVVGEAGDEALARWLQRHLAAPGLARVAVHSNARSGVVLEADGALQVWRRHDFQAAHRLPHVPPGHPCGRLHGHGFELQLQVDAGGRAAAEVADAIDAAWAPLHAELDAVLLNELPGLHNPTSEVLAGWIWQRLLPVLPGLRWVMVFETPSSGAAHDGARWRIWKDLTLDAALQLRRAPAGHALRRIHGHTYRLRLHLCAPLDAVLGWTVDFGDVKRLFEPLFRALDHQPLHQIADLPDNDCASLASWVLGHAQARLPQLDRVDLLQTREAGVTASRHGAPLPL